MGSSTYRIMAFPINPGAGRYIAPVKITYAKVLLFEVVQLALLWWLQGAFL